MTRLSLFSLVVLLAIVGCDCDDDPSNACTTSADCPAGFACLDGVCRSGDDSGVPPDTGGGGCESMTLCGTPPACCAVGDECVDGVCLEACGSGVRCGSDRTTCCGTGQVCISDSCVDPGDPCTDSFDCPTDFFCEPTLGRCLPQFDPLTCEREPVFGAFEPIVEWSAETSADTPECMHGISAPIVVDLTGDGAPEVLANFACDDSWRHGVLRAFSGTGTELWAATATSERLNGRSGIGGADLDGDGRAEIVGMRRPSSDAVVPARAIAFDDDGSVLWQSTDTDGSPLAFTSDNGAPTFADLDMDGSPEVIFGALVLDATGRLVWQADAGGSEGTNSNYDGGISAVADIDLDGMPEVVSGRRAYQHDGTPIWTAATPDGYPAIAQFDMDPQPEIVLVASGDVYVLDGMTGAVEWGPVALPGGGRGGPPTVADFDGDGDPEIGVAGSGSYSVYDPTALADVLWSSTTQDESSNATGSSVFDFEGDGAAEVVYGDECYMRVYSGVDGTVQLEIASSSATIHEYPLVADVDADGNSEIVIVANNRSTGACTGMAGWDGSRKGLFIYGDTRDQWVRTRRIWNQHAYHVTNVTPAGTVPTTEMDNWSTPGLNNYRQNVQGEGAFNAPDLTVLALEVVLDGCPDTATLRARVANEGNLGVPAGVPVAFRTGTPEMPGTLLGVGMTSVALLPGASTVVELPGVPLMGMPPYAFVAVVDDDGTGAGIIVECDEDDNGAAIADLDCTILI